MQAFKLLFFIFVFFYKSEVDCGCKLTLLKDFGDPQPIYLKNGNYLVAGSSAILLRRSERLQVACTGERRSIVLSNRTTDTDVLEAKCVSGTTFRVGQWVGDFKDISCNINPWYTAEETNKRCYKGSKIFRVGYKIKDVFHELYEACFDKNLLTTYYVKHQLTPYSNNVQVMTSRPKFTGGEMFSKTRISELYKTTYQQNRLNALLGKDMEKEYISKNQHLTRGHLAARADFSLKSVQRASFHYINAAPQWMLGNAGDWAALEDGLRRRIQSYGSEVTVYTGTFGVSTLANKKGKQTEIYLGTDANNNDIVPVPLYFYKLVYDLRNKRAAAFVSINSSFYNKTTIKNLQFCSDICSGNSKYSWWKLRSNDETHSFCCSYEDFVKKVDTLPRFNFKKLFY